MGAGRRKQNHALALIHPHPICPSTSFTCIHTSNASTILCSCIGASKHAMPLQTACRFLDVDPSCLHPWKGQSRLQEGGAAVQQLLLPDGRTRWIVGDPLGRDAAICSRSDSGAVNCVTCPRTRRLVTSQAEHLAHGTFFFPIRLCCVCCFVVCLDVSV